MIPLLFIIIPVVLLLAVVVFVVTSKGKTLNIKSDLNNIYYSIDQNKLIKVTNGINVKIKSGQRIYFYNPSGELLFSLAYDTFDLSNDASVKANNILFTIKGYNINITGVYTPLGSPSPSVYTPLRSQVYTPSPSRAFTPSPSQTFTPSPSQTFTPSPSRAFTPSPSTNLDLSKIKGSWNPGTLSIIAGVLEYKPGNLSTHGDLELPYPVLDKNYYRVSISIGTLTGNKSPITIKSLSGPVYNDNLSSVLINDTFTAESNKTITFNMMATRTLNVVYIKVFRANITDILKIKSVTIQKL
jgi:hypothetical protein